MAGPDLASLDWDRPAPFVLPIQVRDEQLDRLGHVNNVEYVRWLEEVSWAHIEQLGMTWDLQARSGRAMAITRTEIDYIRAASAGDRLVLGTWIVAFDGRLRSERRFQLIRPADGATLARAVSWHACIDIRTQRPARVPGEYRDILSGAVSRS